MASPAIDVRDVEYTHNWTVDLQRKIRRCEIGVPKSDGEARVVMLVGKTGDGKTAMLNRMVNYLYGVKWKDDHRYRLVLDSDEESLKASEEDLVSQTQWISVYKFHSGNETILDDDLVIVDTPGVLSTGSCGGSDKKTENMIERLLSLRGYNQITYIHAVVFVVKATMNQLDPVVQQVIDGVLKLWGKNLSKSIFLFTTFSDIEDEPKVVRVFKVKNVPFSGKCFKFNNNRLADFDRSDDARANMVDGYFWEMGDRSLSEFFEAISLSCGQDTISSKKVIGDRDNMDNLLELAMKQIEKRVNTASEIPELKKVLHECERKTTKHEFATEYEIQISLKKRDPLNAKSMICNRCKKNCHTLCPASRVEQCSVMRYFPSKRGCSICNCYPVDHEITAYKYETVTDTHTHVDSEKKKKYDECKDVEQQARDACKEKERELGSSDDLIEVYLNKMRDILKDLEELALTEESRSLKDHLIELRDRASNPEQKPGLEFLIGLEEKLEQTDPLHLYR